MDRATQIRPVNVLAASFDDARHIRPKRVVVRRGRKQPRDNIPRVAIVGGAKVSSKLGALRNMIDRVDKLIIGGAMANTFLKSLGHDVGTQYTVRARRDRGSPIVRDLLSHARAIDRHAREAQR